MNYKRKVARIKKIKDQIIKNIVYLSSEVI